MAQNIRNKRPISFNIRPLNRGMNTSTEPQSIAENETPGSDNIRITHRSAIGTRKGFKKKILGVDDILLWIDFIYSSTAERIVALGSKDIYVDDSGELSPMKLYDINGDELADSPFNIDPLNSVVSIATGFGQFDFAGANAGNKFPGSNSYDTITFVSTGSSDGVYAVVYGTNGPEGERIGGGIAPTLARSLVVFNNRLFIGGDENDNARVLWSAPGLLSDWDTANGAGRLVLGDSPDWIQSLRNLGEYLIVYKERSIYIGRKTNMFDPPVAFEPAPGQGIGLAAPNSIGDLGEEHIFLGWDNIYLFSLNRIKAIGDKIRDEIFYGPNAILPSYVDNCIGVIAEEFAEYWLFVPTGKWPAKSDGNDLENLVTDPLCTNRDDDWTSSDTIDDVDGSLGKNALQSVNLEQDIEVETSGRHSLQVWLKSSENAEVTISIDSFSETVEPPGDEFELYTFSFDISSGSRTLSFDGGTDKFELDAVHLLEIEDVSLDYIGYVDDDPDKEFAGMLNIDREPQQVPLIAYKVGQWAIDTCWAYNYRYESWTRWTIPCTGFGYDVVEPLISVADLEGTIEEQTWRYSEKQITAFAPTNLMAQLDGQIYETNVDIEQDFADVLPQDITCFWESKDIDMDRPDIDKTVTKVVIYHHIDHPRRDIHIGVSTDSGQTWEEMERTIEPGTLQTVAHFIKTGNQMRARVRAEKTPFEISGFGMRVVPRGEHNDYT